MPITVINVPFQLADCINIADEAVGAVAQLLPSLYEFSLQVRKMEQEGDKLKDTFSLVTNRLTHIRHLSILLLLLLLLLLEGIPRHGCCIRVLFTEAEPQFKHPPAAVLLGVDQPWHREHW